MFWGSKSFDGLRYSYRAILHDPEVYADPDSFNPDRFITSEGTLSEDDILSSFGFGRRYVFTSREKET